MKKLWSEKATFWIIVTAIIISFISSMCFIVWLYYQSLDFWAYASICYANEDFYCLANALIERSVINQRLITCISGVASINGIISSLTFLIVYKLKG